MHVQRLLASNGLLAADLIALRVRLVQALEDAAEQFQRAEQLEAETLESARRRVWLLIIWSESSRSTASKKTSGGRVPNRRPLSPSLSKNWRPPCARVQRTGQRTGRRTSE